MLALPLIVALLSAEPTPEPSPLPPKPVASGAPTPLTEIGRVRGRTICASIVVHANAAIDGALDNDRTLGIIIAKLSTLDYENGSVLDQHKALDDLNRFASQLRIQALNGEGEVRRLRELASASTDPERKKELREFADALGGALYRQRRVGVDLQRMATIINGRKQGDDATDLAHGITLAADPGTRRATRELAGRPAMSGHENDQLRSAAADLTERLPLIAADEGVAADHAVGATTGC